MSLETRVIQKRDELRKRLEQTKSEIQNLTALMRADEQALGIVESLLVSEDSKADSRVDASGHTDDFVITLNGNDVTGGKQRPVLAVKNLLRSHPNGLNATEVVELLLPHVITTSNNPRNILHNTLAGLTHRGSIVKTAEGLYRLPGP